MLAAPNDSGIENVSNNQNSHNIRKLHYYNFPIEKKQLLSFFFILLTEIGQGTDCEIPSTSNMNITPLESDENYDAGELYSVISKTTTHSNKFNSTVTDTIIKLKEIKKDPHSAVKSVFDKLLEVEMKEIDQHAKVGIVLSNDTYPKPLFISLRERSQITTEVILGQVEKVIQSNEKFFLNEPLQVKITQISLPEGQKRNKNLYLVPFDVFCKKQSKSIVTINNSNDNLCLARAIVVGMTHEKYKAGEISYNEYRAVSRADRENAQKNAALELCQKAGIEDINNFKGTLEDVQRFQNILPDHEITVFCGSDIKGRTILYRGNTGKNRHIDLILGNNHYNAIINLKGAFGHHYYCRNCFVGYDHLNAHRCKNACLKCRSPVACKPEQGIKIKCTGCNFYFNNTSCFENHKKPKLEFKKSVCDVTKFCYECEQAYTLNKKKTVHKCGYHLCLNCQKYVAYNHKCYVQNLPKRNENSKDLYVFFDFEARIDCEEHVPNFCVIQHQCFNCFERDDIKEDCQTCGKREHVIKKEGDALIEEFMNIIIQKSTAFDKIYALAHNGGGYDFQFIVKHMIREKGWTPEIVHNGSKIMSMKYKNLHFKDTLNFFNTRLASLPKMIDIPEAVKGYFPHYFNRPENYDYIGPIPETHYYGPDEMEFSAREKFLKWHHDQKDKVFNFKEEIEKYCQSDVEILRKASLKFKQLFMSILSVDAFASSTTIASACMRGYRTNFLPPETVGLMTSKSYRRRENQSDMALRYLLYLEKLYGVEFQSAYRGQEKKLNNYTVDGYCKKFPISKLNNCTNDGRSEAEVIVEIQGCYFHGCPKCFTSEERRANIEKKKNGTYLTMQHRYENTRKKIKNLKNLPSKPVIIEVWECEIKEACKTDETLRQHMNDPNILHQIRSNREAFFGGRTECFRKYYKIKPGQKIFYIDVNSLYPFINKYGIYPIGHPIVLVGDDAKNCKLEDTVGIAMVKILPPNQLLYPVLPVKANNKLVFALCRTCAELGNHASCEHSEADREITGTYTCIELQEAMKKGYKIKEIYEVWSYKATVYNNQLKQGGIFAEYIDTFLKIKQATSGYPPSVKTDQDKIEFCKKFEEREGVPLAPDDVKPNPGLRSLSKLCLNR